MLMEEQARATGTAAAEVGSGGVLKALHHPAKAKRVVQLFMAGAASHVDLWDYKPSLEKHHGEASNFGEHVEAFQDGLGPWMKSPFKFAAYGQSGKFLSDAVEPMGAVVDDIAFIHNMVGKTGVHSQATYLQATGFDRPGFPGADSGFETTWAAGRHDHCVDDGVRTDAVNSGQQRPRSQSVCVYKLVMRRWNQRRDQSRPVG